MPTRRALAFIFCTVTLDCLALGLMLASSAAMAHSAPWNPAACNISPPRKNPTPFIAFFDPVNQATQRNNWPDPPSDVVR